MLYDNVVCNELVACACVCIPVICMYIYNKYVHYNKYSAWNKYRKKDKTVHIVVDKPTIQPRTRIRLACIQLVDGQSKPVYIHEHNLFSKK